MATPVEVPRVAVMHFVVRPVLSFSRSVENCCNVAHSREAVVMGKSSGDRTKHLIVFSSEVL